MNQPVHRLRLLFCVAACSALLVACGSGGGEAANANPAPTPAATTSIAMDGVWQCDYSTIVSTNTGDTQEFRLGDIIEIAQGQIVGQPQLGLAWVLPDAQPLLGFAWGWYYNAVNGSRFDCHLGWDRLVEGAGEQVDYWNYGLRLAATGPDQIAGYESSQSQQTALAAPTQWTAALSFVRLDVPPYPSLLAPEGSEAQDTADADRGAAVLPGETDR